MTSRPGTRSNLRAPSSQRTTRNYALSNHIEEWTRFLNDIDDPFEKDELSQHLTSHMRWDLPSESDMTKKSKIIKKYLAKCTNENAKSIKDVINYIMQPIEIDSNAAKDSNFSHTIDATNMKKALNAAVNRNANNDDQLQALSNFQNYSNFIAQQPRTKTWTVPDWLGITINAPEALDIGLQNLQLLTNKINVNQFECAYFSEESIKLYKYLFWYFFVTYFMDLVQNSKHYLLASQLLYRVSLSFIQLQISPQVQHLFESKIKKNKFSFENLHENTTSYSQKNSKPNTNRTVNNALSLSTSNRNGTRNNKSISKSSLHSKSSKTLYQRDANANIVSHSTIAAQRDYFFEIYIFIVAESIYCQLIRYFSFHDKWLIDSRIRDRIVDDLYYLINGIDLSHTTRQQHLMQLYPIGTVIPAPVIFDFTKHSQLINEQTNDTTGDHDETQTKDESTTQQFSQTAPNIPSNIVNKHASIATDNELGSTHDESDSETKQKFAPGLSEMNGRSGMDNDLKRTFFQQFDPFFLSIIQAKHNNVLKHLQNSHTTDIDHENIDMCNQINIVAYDGSVTIRSESRDDTNGTTVNDQDHRFARKNKRNSDVFRKHVLEGRNNKSQAEPLSWLATSSNIDESQLPLQLWVQSGCPKPTQDFVNSVIDMHDGKQTSVNLPGIKHGKTRRPIRSKSSGLLRMRQQLVPKIQTINSRKMSPLLKLSISTKGIKVGQSFAHHKIEPGIRHAGSDTFKPFVSEKLTKSLNNISCEFMNVRKKIINNLGAANNMNGFSSNNNLMGNNGPGGMNDGGKHQSKKRVNVDRMFSRVIIDELNQQSTLKKVGSLDSYRK